MTTNKVTICNVRNRSDNEELQVCAKWTDDIVKVLIARSDNTLLTGEVALEWFSELARRFDKTLNLYIEEVQGVFSGNNEEIEFSLENNEFRWKKKMWLLGKISVQPSAVNDLADFTIFFMKNFLKTNTYISELEKDKENLKTENVEIKSKFKDVIEAKDKMERDMYKRFILVLNSKKEKNREMRNKMEKSEKKKDNVFDATTDSENEEIVNEDMCVKKDFTGKRPLDNTKEESAKKSKGDIVSRDNIWFKVNVRNEGHSEKSQFIMAKQTENVEEEKSKNVKQTDDSRELKNLKSNATKLPKNKDLSVPIGEDEETPDFISDESDFEMELKLEEDKNENDYELIHQESEEIMFN